MASSKAEFVAAGDAPATTLLSPSTTVSSSSTGARPDVQTRKSNRSRTSNFLSSTLLRPRGKSVSYTRANDWGRPVGGSEGLGSIYNATMDTRERSQVLRSVTHLTKDRSNDVSGAAAEAFSGNATPSLAPRSRFFASFRSGSSTNVGEAHTPEAPPSYQQPEHRPELRRGSEGSVVSHISLPRPDGALTHSSSRLSLSSSRPSYFSSAASSSASGSAISSGYTSVAASPGPGSCLGKQQQLQQQPQWQSSSSSSSSSQQRRSSSHLGAAARQAVRSSRSFLGLPNGDISEDAEVAQNRQVADTNGSPDKALDMDVTKRQAKQVASSDEVQLKQLQQPRRSHPGEAATGSSETMTGFTAAIENNDEAGGSRPEARAAELQSLSRGAAVCQASNLDSAAAAGAAAAGQAPASCRPIGPAHPTHAAAAAAAVSAGLSGRREISTTAGVSAGGEARAESPAMSKFSNLSNFAKSASKSDPPSQRRPSAKSPASAAPASAVSASASTVSQAPVPLRSPVSASAAAASSQDDVLSPLRPSAAASPLQPVSSPLTLPQSPLQSQFASSSQQKPSIRSPALALETNMPAYSTASSTPLTSALPSVTANDTSSSLSSSSPSHHLNPSSSLLTSPSSLRTPSRSDIGVAAPSSSSTTTSTTTYSSATHTAASTATTEPLQSTSKLAPVLRSGSSSLLSPQRDSFPSASASATASASASTTPNSQHVSSHPSVPLDSHPPTAKQGEPSTFHRSAELSSPPSASASVPSPHHEPGTFPLTPPSSSGPCLSPRSSVSGASGSGVATHVIQQSTHDLPSPPASTVHGSVSDPASRRGSSNDPLASSVRVRSPRSSFASLRPSSQALEPTVSSSGTGRVSFDLRRISLFGGAKMPSNGPRASFAGVGNGQPPQAAGANGVRHASSPPSNSTSKFFSRISLPGGNRRGSGTNESPLSSPESKSRSRFASFGRLGRGSDAQTSPNGTRGLRNSMQPWASASTDVLAAEGRNSLALAREEATRPRKSLHLPRSNLIDLDAEDTSDTTASTSTATHGFDSRALPPIAAASIKPEKPASPSLHSARRPSLNFLRRASATSTNSNAENANGERRGSFARNFMNRTLSRNSKNENQQEALRSTQTSHGEVESPAYRNGIFDTQSLVSASSVVYPGMSSTVNWNAPAATQSKEHADIGPGDVDPSVVIPAYPGTGAAVSDASVQPKNVADLASGVLAERRPSQGIDQEQDAAEEAGDTVSSTLASSRPSSATATAVQSTDSTATRQRPTRTSHALSHLPRLNSMRAIGGASVEGAANGARTARTGSESTTGTTAGETSDEEQEPSEDEDDTDVTGQTSDYHDLDTETEDETDDDTSPTASRHIAAAPMAATGSSGGLNRNRPTEALVLPPAPSFIPNPTSAFSTAGADGIATAATGTGANGGAFNQTVGRESWTSFNPSGFTPFETPTPSFGGGSFNAAFAGPTPRARQELSESSYFAARPGTSNSGRATTAGTMSGDAPPPSPSIISRSRAPSSASMRTLRTPGAGAMSSGPVPNRSMPAPVGALPPLALHRQISAASGSTARGGADRSKSPALASASSRPGTSGTLTPHQAPPGERISSREPSIDRPSSERPASRQEDGKAATPKTTGTRPIVGLDGMPVSNARPNFYQQKSRSLVDLLGPASRRLEIDTVTPPRPVINEPSGIDALRTPTTPRPTSEVPAYSKKDGLAPINTGLTAPASIASPGGMSLGRRRSMFEMRAEPPPYSIIHNRPEGPQIILPREEEGREKLPTYCCGVHIEGYLPRKMEFSSPGVQAKDRSWRRQYFVLHGTSLRVYKNDLSVDRHAANGSWGEMKGVHVHLEPMNEDGSNGSGSGIGLGAAAREAISHTPLGHHRNDASKNKEVGTEFDSKNGLVRNYTLQGAESGLAADYLKRRHVVRVRAEGEQFLLQTRSDRHVVDWIEALQAATNVSMDLEKRPMPKFITLPRRRRRRRRNPDGTTVSPEEQEARDLAEAQRRSMADTGARGAVGAAAGAGGAEATPRTSMAGRPSMSIENELNPSAAFERMLREDQEEGGRQTAAVM